jgi:CRP-like cAMP-binding protein
MESVFSEEEIRFNRLNLDYIKKNDLRLVFEILMSEP